MKEKESLPIVVNVINDSGIVLRFIKPALFGIVNAVIMSCIMENISDNIRNTFNDIVLALSEVGISDEMI